MKEKVIVEVCCGSYYDAKQAVLGGASRIELNSALWMGGLTPTTAVMKRVRKDFPDLKIIAMVRPRGAGFCYSRDEVAIMLEEAGELIKVGADGIAFGFLREDRSIHESDTVEMVKVIKGYKKEAVFHRAFDCLEDWKKGTEILLEAGVDRILTSGLSKNALSGMEVIGNLEKNYGSKIQILAGGGICAKNVISLLKETGIKQVHSSCKTWLTDPTTRGKEVSYGYAGTEKELMYEVVDENLVRKLVTATNY